MPVLDGVRGVAVLIVICFHFWQDSHVEHIPWSATWQYGEKQVLIYFLFSQVF